MIEKRTSLQPYIKIRAHNLEVAYDNFVALRCRRFSLAGNNLAVIGHNGAGKSTFIKSLLGLQPISFGKLAVQRVEPESRYPLVPERHMSFCPETGSVFADISVESYIKLWSRVKMRDANYYKRDGSKYIELLNLAPLMGKLGRELSKGQRRRVQTAIGFISQPRLFLFDEPFDGLDVQKTSELADIIASHENEMSFLISSHRMDVVERLADAIIVLQSGQIVSSGSVEEVCKDLCEQSIKIGNLSNLQAVTEMLRSEFPKVVVSCIGEEISLTGRNLKLHELEQSIRNLDRNGAVLSQAKPSLVDAMAYHLKSI